MRSLPARVATMVFMALYNKLEYEFNTSTTLIPGNCWTVISSKHKNHLDELRRMSWKPALEPEQADDTTDTNIFFENFRDTHSSIKQFLSSLI
jgi:protein involved in sex pheromone biosynthesis